MVIARHGLWPRKLRIQSTARLARESPRTPKQPTAEEAKVSEWKKIKTAPKDGSTIIIWDGQSVLAAYWEKDKNENQGGKPGWTNGYFDSHYEENFIFNATHWMPLPKPPED